MALILNGDGSIQSLVAGGLPDATVQPSDLTQPLTLGTSVATTSGTSIDFTGIPSWVKRITVMLNGVSTSGTSNIQIQLGSGAVTTTGYSQYILNGNASGSSSATTGFALRVNVLAAELTTGVTTLGLFASNTWAAQTMMTVSPSAAAGSIWGTGVVTLSGAIDRIRLTTVNGTDTFDAGSVNILYE